MTGPPAATAAVRTAVRRDLRALDPTALVVAAVSGGADSLALAAALAFERPGSGALVVDHRLQPGSAEVAARAVEQCRSLGLSARVLTAATPGVPPHPPGASCNGACTCALSGEDATGGGAGSTAGRGPEGAARGVRYALLDSAAAEFGAVAVLLGHTLDDQAETVLLGLARGSGARALAGMAPVRGRYRRPLLEVDRATTEQACAEAGLEPWHDPHNADPSFARVRARTTVLPALETALGPGVAAALARTARQLREDADALDALTVPSADATELAALPAALRSRSLKRWAEQQTGRAVTAAHVDALRALVEDWHGQGPVALPGGTSVSRQGGRLVAVPPRLPTGGAGAAPVVRPGRSGLASTP